MKFESLSLRTAVGARSDGSSQGLSSTSRGPRLCHAPRAAETETSIARAVLTPLTAPRSLHRAGPGPGARGRSRGLCLPEGKARLLRPERGAAPAPAPHTRERRNEPTCAEPEPRLSPTTCRATEGTASPAPGHRHLVLGAPGPGLVPPAAAGSPALPGR